MDLRPVIVHDYLLQRGGAERVVEELAAAFPGAKLATSIVSESYRAQYADRELTTSYLQRARVDEHNFRALLPLLADAFARLRLPPADVALCSSSGWAHLVTGHTEMPVVVYCHTPARWLWRPGDYFRTAGARAERVVLTPLLATLRTNDRRHARMATRYVANSATVAERIARCYGIEAAVVHPPVDVDRFRADRPREDFYLVVARLLDYKRLDLAVDACSWLGRRLLVVGSGPALERLRARAGPSVRFLGWQPEARVTELMETSRALIFPGEEDFGITAVEAMAAGAPVVAFRGGGARETVAEGVTGVLFDRQEVADVTDALVQVESRSWQAETLREHAHAFAAPRFRRQMRALIHDTVASGWAPVSGRR